MKTDWQTIRANAQSVGDASPPRRKRARPRRRRARQRADCAGLRVIVSLIKRCGLLLLVIAFIGLTPGIGSNHCQAQEDFYPLPQRNPSGFGFPYPPPAADEPGVTFNRRYMLDGHPELEFNPRPQDEVWLISTRSIQGATAPVALDQFVCKHVVGTAWNQVPLQQLLDVQRGNPDKATVVFLHGNRTSQYWARRRGKQAYQVLFGNNPVNMPPVRFVIWSWPTDPLVNPIQDFEKKMDRSVLDGRLFGQFLSCLDHQQPLKLVTYSLGTQVAFLGLENVATQTGSCPQIDMIAMAPVTHCQWPASPQQLENTACRIQSLRFFRNPNDLAIKAYKAFCTLRCKKRFVPGADIISGVHPNVSQFDVRNDVGREHNVLGYVSQPQVSHALESFLRR